MVNYSDAFLKIINSNTFIGLGNPSSSVLLVGKEVATDKNSENLLERQNHYNYEKNCEYWLHNVFSNRQSYDIKDWTLESPTGENNPLFAFRGSIIKKEGETWRKYQKLHDEIFRIPPKYDMPKNGHNFQLNMFLTEMSVEPSKTSLQAQGKENFKENLQKRKDTFFMSKFIQSFPVVVLACSNYITGGEIEDIFGVKFTEQKGNGKQLFWTHHNSQQSKLVIHTRQLSANVSNSLLENIGAEIRDFLKAQ